MGLIAEIFLLSLAEWARSVGLPDVTLIAGMARASAYARATSCGLALRHAQRARLEE